LRPSFSALRCVSGEFPGGFLVAVALKLLNMDEIDMELLARYRQRHAEDAFAELVQRHLGLVHSAALRQVRIPHLAEEVAQSTFIKLARHAGQLAPDTLLTAWLYQVTRREAIDVIRRDARRQLREQVATEMNAMNATTADWAHIEPLLDEAMHALDETDRTAVLLRYFENKSLREVGATLGTSENAAQKRLARAVERLREFFAKRGVTVGASGLVVVISANAIQVAPVGLGAAIATSALGSFSGLSISTLGIVKWMIMTNLKTTLVIAVCAAEEALACVAYFDLICLT
jgi:RNA polymerase sigma factor (sigma-70 family)